MSGRSLESVLEQEFAPDTALLALVRPLLKFETDEAQRTLTASVGNARATAAFVEGLGCVLLRGIDLAEARSRALPPRTDTVDPAQIPWPDGERLPDKAAAEGVDMVALLRAGAEACKQREGRLPPRTRAIVVVRRGQIVMELYDQGIDARTPLPGWSMTKTVAAMLLGIRVAQDRLDVAAPLPVPGWQDAGDPRRSLRLHHLLTMQSGLQWREAEDDAAGDVARMLFLEPSTSAFAAGRPLAAAPGSTFVYSSGTTNILCEVLRRTFTDDADYRAFPRRALFDRIGMRSALIATDPGGTLVGSSLGFATARDWARFGMLLLQDGVWNGVQVVPSAWIKEALIPAEHAERGQFGRHVWLNRGSAGDPERRPFPRLPPEAFLLQGFEGQTVAVFPKQQLVVVRLGCSRRGSFDLHGFLAQVVAACAGG